LDVQTITANVTNVNENPPPSPPDPVPDPETDSDGDGIPDSQDQDSDLFDGNDQSSVDDGINTGLVQTRTFSDTTIDGVPATTGTTTDRDTGESVNVICLNPVVAGSRQDTDATTDDVDVHVNARVSLSLTDNQGLIAAERSGSSREDLATLLARHPGADPEAQHAFLDQLYATGDRADIVELTPTHDSSDNNPTRLHVSFDHGEDPQVVILDLSHWQGDSLPEVEVSGQGHVVIRGAGHFFGESDELADNPELDNDNILGDDQAQVLFFGPGNDLIHGAGGNDTVASSGGIDHLYGDAGNDLVIGGADADILYGGDGNDTLQGGLSDAGTWQFSLNPEQGIHLQFTPGEIELPETAGRFDSWLTEEQNWSVDARFNFTSADHNNLVSISNLYHAVTGELPSVEELNNIVGLNQTPDQLAELAYNFYQQNAPMQGQEISSQVTALFDQVWGEGNASESDIQLGTDYILNGGSWSQGLLALSLHDTHQQQIENAQGELILAQDYALDETGWSADSSNDQLFGGNGDDILIGGQGSDLLDGGEGQDTAVQIYNLENYHFRINTEGQLQLANNDSALGVDTLIDVETIRFGDQAVDSQCSNMDSEQLQTAAALHQLMTGQVPTLLDLNSYAAMATEADLLAGQLLETAAGNGWNALDNRQFVDELADRVLETPLSAADLDYWQGQLDTEALSRAEAFVLCLGVRDFQDNLFADDGMTLG